MVVRLRAAQQEQALAVAVDALERGPQARVGAQVRGYVVAALRHPRAQHLLAHVLDLDALLARGGMVPASADSMAIMRLSRYSSSCSKQMYSTLAWPLWAMLRAIWSDIVVLPVPCAPPISISSPARMPPPRSAIQRREAQRDRLVLGDLAGADLLGEAGQHLDGATRLER